LQKIRKPSAKRHCAKRQVVHSVRRRQVLSFGVRVEWHLRKRKYMIYI
jgi:hypothetical protein